MPRSIATSNGRVPPTESLYRPGGRAAG
jgi:hypothetical protein